MSISPTELIEHFRNGGKETVRAYLKHFARDHKLTFPEYFSQIDVLITSEEKEDIYSYLGLTVNILGHGETKRVGTMGERNK